MLAPWRKVPSTVRDILAERLTLVNAFRLGVETSGYNPYALFRTSAAVRINLPPGPLQDLRS